MKSIKEPKKLNRYLSKKGANILIFKSYLACFIFNDQIKIHKGEYNVQNINYNQLYFYL